MLNPIQAFKDVNSAVQNVTGYSFSLSNIPKNINKIAFPAIALATGMYVAASESKGGSSILHIAERKDFMANCGEDCIVVSNYDDCIFSCVRGCLKYNEKFIDELGKCMRVCVDYFFPCV